MAGYGSVLIVRRQMRDSDGDPTGESTDTILCGWDIAPAGSTEQTDGGARESTTDRLQAFGGPAFPDIVPGDRVYLEHDPSDGPPPWYVVGNPDDWAGPDWDPGRVVNLQRHRS